MKILLVEDEIDLREILVFMLESRLTSPQIIQASSGNQAIRLISEHPDINLVLCDYMMPDGTGGDVFRFLLSKNSTTPFILFSSDSPEMYSEFQGQKPAGFLRKPFAVSPLIQLIHEVMANGGKTGFNPDTPLNPII